MREEEKNNSLSHKNIVDEEDSFDKLFDKKM